MAEMEHKGQRAEKRPPSRGQYHGATEGPQGPTTASLLGGAHDVIRNTCCRPLNLLHPADCRQEGSLCEPGPAQGLLLLKVVFPDLSDLKGVQAPGLCGAEF